LGEHMLTHVILQLEKSEPAPHAGLRTIVVSGREPGWDGVAVNSRCLPI
jgi:hypothetical protein